MVCFMASFTMPSAKAGLQSLFGRDARETGGRPAGTAGTAGRVVTSLMGEHDLP